MDKLDNRVMVYLTEELAEWLEARALEGYKKASLIRKIIAEHVRKEGDGDGNGSVR